MAATYRTSAAGGSSTGTSNRTVAITPAVGDLLVVYCFVAANTNDAPTCSDNNGSGTYDLVDVMNASIGGINYRLSVFIRTALMANTTSTTITVATGSNTSGAVHAIAVSGMSRTGANAVRSKGSQNNQAAGTAAPALNQSALTGNMTIVAIGSADTTTTAPTNWTERQDTNFSNDTVALETATRDSGFTGTTITFGAAQSTVFCSHALELDNSALFTRAVAIDGAGTVASDATFFTVFERSSAVDGAGTVATTGRRDLLRSTALSVTGSLATVSTFFSVFDGSASLTGSASIESTSIFFSVFSGSVAVDGAGTVESSASFFSTFERAATLDGSGSCESSAVFFTTFDRAATLDGAVAITASGQVVSGPSTFERSSLIDASVDVSSGGLSLLERAGSANADVTVSVAGQFFTILERTASLSSATSLESSSQRDILRSSTVAGAGDVAATGTFFSVLQASVQVACAGSIECAGSSALPEHERSILIAANLSIISSGLVIQPIVFRPREIMGVGKDSRRVLVSNESRSTDVEARQQANVL